MSRICSTLSPYAHTPGGYRNVGDYGDLKPWVGHMLHLLVQNHTKVLWNRQWRDEMKVGPQKWLCSRKSVVIGLKPRFFNSEWGLR